MTKGQKKPWSKVGKLERRVEELEKELRKFKDFYKIDHEETNKQLTDLKTNTDRELKLLHSCRNIVLKDIRATIDNLIDPEAKNV